jgi:hypothetical protein
MRLCFINNHIKPTYFLEGVKLTFFCLSMVVLLKFFGLSNQTSLVMFNLVVTAAIVTFATQLDFGSNSLIYNFIILLSAISAGLIGFYSPNLARAITIVLAGLAFYLPKKKGVFIGFIFSTTTFVVFSSNPFNFITGIKYLIIGLIAMISLKVYFYCFNNFFHAANNGNKKIDHGYSSSPDMSLIVMISLIVATMVSKVILHYYITTHLYWMPLTIIMVVQTSQQATIVTSVKRIVANVLGALVMIIMFDYLLPDNFWINICLLIICLMLIFTYWDKYVWRNLFVELFVFGCAHLVGVYQDSVAVDRIIFTLCGGSLVIIVTLVVVFCKKFIF